MDQPITLEVSAAPASPEVSAAPAATATPVVSASTPQALDVPSELLRAVKLPASDYAAGMPTNWLKSLLFTRAGVPPKHELRAGLGFTHASCRGPGVPMLPANFTWPDPKPLTLGAALAAVDAASVVQK